MRTADLTVATRGYLSMSAADVRTTIYIYSSKVKSLITYNAFCILQTATAKPKTGGFRDYGVAEAPPGFQATISIFPLELSAEISPFDSIRKGRVYTQIPDDGLNHQLSCCESSIFLSVFKFTSLSVEFKYAQAVGVSAFSSSFQSILHGRFGNL
jgi:hypothetical protein